MLVMNYKKDLNLIFVLKVNQTYLTLEYHTDAFFTTYTLQMLQLSTNKPFLFTRFAVFSLVMSICLMLLLSLQDLQVLMLHAQLMHLEIKESNICYNRANQTFIVRFDFIFICKYKKIVWLLQYFYTVHNLV